MARPRSGGLHSAIVSWLKVLLPLGALAILSTLFLLSNTIDPSKAIPFAKVDVEARAREPRMTDPTYAGKTSDGAALTLSAAEARAATDTTDPNAFRTRGTLQTPDGGRTDVSALTAHRDTAANTLVLEGDVQVSNSSGWHVTSPRMTAALDRTSLDAVGPVAAEGPPGTITADTMRLSQDPKRPESYLLVFNGRVKLIYTPSD